MNEQHLYPLKCLDPSEGEDYGLLVLNQPLQPQMKVLETIWQKAVVKATIDGGTNELYDNTEKQRDSYIPDIITGDFDSARPEVLNYYKEKGVEIIQTEDQDYTDFTKCLQLLTERNMFSKVNSVIVLGAFGGRMDQIFANIETLFTAKTILPGKPVYLFSQESVACLLSEGHNILHTSSPCRGDWCGLIPVGSSCGCGHNILHTSSPCRGDWCGLIPVGSSCGCGHNILHTSSPCKGDWCGLIPVGSSCDCVTTTGLKWNLDRQRLKFGELISTSNTWQGDSGIVTIETDQPLLWTMGIR